MRSGHEPQPLTDAVATEEPLALKINGSLFATLMRSPGREQDLVAGFLASETIIDGVDEISAFKECNTENTVNIALVDGCDLASHTARRTLVSSSCGVCGSRSIDELQQELNSTSVQQLGDLDVGVLLAALKEMRGRQDLFSATAGTHAVALFDIATQTIIDIAEDVGRHNAADKVIGKQLLSGNYPLSKQTVLLLSGRVSFDMVQKAARADIGAICAVGMPTSLAIESAQAVGMKLYAWAREGSVCLY
ncbi:MAG: FdhD protein [Myxococcota bacterium]|jgi:FdhD protein